MKGCPLCKRGYSNEAFNYCPIDGAILSASIAESAPVSNPSTFDQIDEESPASVKYILEDMILPYLGTAISEATITKWHKRMGEAVKSGEPLYDCSTSKVDLEVPVQCSGVLFEILVEVGQTVPVGTPIARIKRLNMKID